MTTRTLVLVLSLLIGTCAIAQAENPDVRLVPDIDRVVIDAPSEMAMDSTGVFIMVEEKPEFPGGMAGLSAYVSQHLRYPNEASQKNIEGHVFLSFIVEKDGTVSNVSVVRGIGRGCDEEAVRVVSEMPTWKPGRQGGKPVRTQFHLPIRFKLAD